MRERQQLHELSSAVSLGLLSEDMVLTIGRVLRSEPLEPGDRLVLEAAKRLFATFASEEVVLAAPASGQMLPDRAYLDALRAMESHTQNEQIQVVASRIVGLLETVLADRADADLADQLLALRGLFIDVGKSTLIRANDLSRARQEPDSWRPTQAISSF